MYDDFIAMDMKHKFLLHLHDHDVIKRQNENMILQTT